MALSKIQAESMNLADTYAFTGTVSGAGEANDYVHLSTTNSTNVASVDLSYGSGYGSHIVIVKNLYTQNDSDFRMRWKTSSGVVTSSNYHHSAHMHNSAGSADTYQGSNADYHYIFGAVDNNGNGEDIRSSCFIHIPKVTTGNNPSYSGHGYVQHHNGGRFTLQFAGIHSSLTSEVTGLSFFAGSGNLADISISIYGVKDA